VFSYLTESALLTHGLVSVSEELLLQRWPEGNETIVWVDQGRIVTGGMKSYIPFRRRAGDLIRIDCFGLKNALEEKKSGALTASGTMAVCAELGIPLAVSCGIGGIGDIRGEELCPDLPALEKIPVVLLATSFKDMLDIRGSVQYIRERGVPVYGIKEAVCTGYLFRGEETALDGVFSGDMKALSRGLLLNPIPEDKRIHENEYLEMGIAAGKQAEAEGRYYHPAANAAFDRLTNGRSSEIQLDSLIANVSLAEHLMKQ